MGHNLSTCRDLTTCNAPFIFTVVCLPRARLAQLPDLHCLLRLLHSSFAYKPEAVYQHVLPIPLDALLPRFLPRHHADLLRSLHVHAQSSTDPRLHSPLVVCLPHFNHLRKLWNSCFRHTEDHGPKLCIRTVDNGEEILNSNRPAVFIVNHQTELDVLLLGWIWPKHCSVTAKKSLRNVPFLGWFMTLSGTVFIDRVDRSQAMK